MNEKMRMKFSDGKLSCVLLQTWGEKATEFSSYLTTEHKTIEPRTKPLNQEQNEGSRAKNLVPTNLEPRMNEFTKNQDTEIREL